jgi:hypothetical protein
VVSYVSQIGLKLEGGVHGVPWFVLMPAGLPIWPDSKGHDHPSGRRSRKAVLERWGIEIRLWAKHVVL